ncbi:surfeit locus protein 6 homolog isoform X1 [Nasonia vitripennis]|uniref:Ribosomal RNA-processing protein 14/surfeit locus protein 6 C-terminal domain-containing protein n=1 Tax=Nasonia vitripennis TaxID=7425 RepID=A0A7M7G647_NASVI|nr:surfeit locus protein 6 homolog isoform X1 [Nasonia vitripennis]
MKLKMSKPFNAKLVKQMLLEEDKFISDIFSKMPLPANELVAQNGHEDYEKEFSNRKKEKVFAGFGEKAKRAHTFEELHAKFNELKGKKLNYKDKLLKKGLKNRIQKKTKREERLMQKKLARTERMAAEANGTQKVKEEGDAPKAPKQKPIFNSKGNMVFSKFDFSEIGTKKKTLKAEKDPKKLLKQLEEKKRKVQELEEAGEKEKAQEIKEKDAWKSALAKATGEKVKDDPELLKRTIKREEQKKKHSHKKWESRQVGVQKAVQERQQKRSENIMKRKKDVKTNKLKRAAKKGRIIPGF